MNKIIYAILGLLFVADAVITNYLINSGIAYEGNPLLSGFAGTWKLVALKALGLGLVLLIFNRKSNRNSKTAKLTFAKIIIFSYIGIYALVVVWNTSLILNASV